VSGLIGGPCADYLLRRLADRDRFPNRNDGRGGTIETLLGIGLWRDIARKTVIVHGSGRGDEAIDIARHGARRVIGIEADAPSRADARRKAGEAGVDDRCSFVAECTEKADLVVSIGCFDYDGDPAATLNAIFGWLRPNGVALLSFGPPWLHPFGGHALSAFPWAHLILTERALTRWSADFKPDPMPHTADRRGPSRMTIRRFHRALAESDFEIDRFEAVPLPRWAWIANPLTREFVTAVVRCRLIARPSGRADSGAAVSIWLDDEAPASSW
jgi:SAM-dependent methyltransferase